VRGLVLSRCRQTPLRAIMISLVRQIAPLVDRLGIDCGLEDPVEAGITKIGVMVPAKSAPIAMTIGDQLELLGG